MKTFRLIVVFVCITIFGNAKPMWVTFTDDNPSKPIIQLNFSSNQRMEYNIIIPGMYSEAINNGINYHRLSIPEGSTWGEPGFPEIPVIASMVAIPECAGYTITIEPIDSVVFNDVNLYPVPLLIHDSSGFHQEFYRNDSVYSLDLILPGIQFDSKEGYLRSQRTLNIFDYAFKYNPQQKLLVVYTNFHVIVNKV